MAPESAVGFNGRRVTALRNILGLTQTALAHRLSVTQSFLSQVENGDRPVPESLVVAASQAFGIPVAFFAVRPTPLEAGPVTFRKTSRASAKDEARISELYSEAARLFRVVSAESGYVTAHLPDPAEFGGDPEEVAVAMRRTAGLGHEDPVLNATRCLERFGIGVVDRLDDMAAGGAHTGVSRPSRLNDRPLVALATVVPGAVKRLTLLHEAYHLIADRDLTEPIPSTRSPEEQRAFDFASAFLLPEQVLRAQVSESLSLHGYLPIKAQYGLTVGAIIRRARNRGVITSDRYRSLNIQLSSAGWKTNEPVEVADEKPLLFAQALAKAFGGQAVARASHVVGVAPAWIHRWTNTSGSDIAASGSNRVIDISLRRRRAGRN